MGRAPCCDKANVKKGPWSPEEDEKLKEYIQNQGTGGNWIALPQKAGLRRCGKSCRLRWLNYLRPNIKHGEFSDDEDRIICSLFASIGSRWSVIAAQLPGRTDNDIKNYWNTKLKKKLMGTTNNTMVPSSQRRPQISLLQSSSSPSLPSSTYINYFTGYESVSTLIPTSRIVNITSSSSDAILQGFEYAKQVEQALQLNIEAQENLLTFGGEGSCSSSDVSSNNNCIKELEYENGVYSNGENMGYHHQNCIYTGIEDANYTCANGAAQEKLHHGCYSNNYNNGDQTSLLDYSLEEIKQLISTNNISSSSLNNMTEEKALYHYYHY